ncbi:hypothetical protein CkaCkLH20_10666 [Colletotrichum karsti]|uniref:Uncharacterized protein n=1 Tax=Colletotrichum karsti TaxID=1095194 RepID=A0A9P6HXA6_9PEZI|nr:uncharacterized protein CkaCkLH20_10666 [Colletotrichum karsti]KAF9871732.1 hypothetical protein CkaCkLH20_10666 [Colletotrichum karsti]
MATSSDNNDVKASAKDNASSDIHDIKASVKDNAAGVYAYGQRQINRVVSFDTRQKAYGDVSDFAQRKPLLFSFIVAQLVFSSLPIIACLTFAFSTIVFALGAAVIFTLFWACVALLFLVPTLFFTCSVGIVVWIWAAGSFFVVKWLYEMSPVSTKGEIRVDVPNGNTHAITKNEGGIDVHTVQN